MSTNTFRAEAPFRTEPPKEKHQPPRTVAGVPSAVRDHFDAKPGDRLVFVKGNTHLADVAALRPGGYLIVTLERAPEAEPCAARAADEGGACELATLEDAVRRKVDDRRRV